MLAEEKLIRSSDTIDFWLTISSVKQKNTYKATQKLTQ